MLTINYQDLQERYSKKKKKKTKKVEKPISNKKKYQDQLKDRRWVDKRNQVMKRDGFQCLICHSKKKLNVHHLVYKKDKMAWEYPTDILITLCEECHHKVHNDPNHKFYPRYE